MRLAVFDDVTGDIRRIVSCPDADAPKQAKAGEGWITVTAPVDSETHRVNISTLQIEEI